MNEYLKLDPDAQNRLDAYQGKSLVLEITDWRMSVCIYVCQQGLQLLPEKKGEATATLTGTLAGFLQLMRSAQAGHYALNASVSITGDVMFVQQLQQVVSQMSIDWESQWARWLGDHAAYRVVAGLGAVKEAILHARCVLHENTTTYIHNGAQLAPTSQQILFFTEQVAKVQHDVDRIALQIERLMRAKNKELSKR